MQAGRRQTQKALARAIPLPCKTSASARTPSFIRNLGMVETTSVAAAARPVQRVKSLTLAEFPITPIPGARFQFHADALISPWIDLGSAQPLPGRRPQSAKANSVHYCTVSRFVFLYSHQTVVR